MGMNSELTLTDLIDLEMLQRLQDSFSNMTGMSALTADRNGAAVTKGSNFSDFCIKTRGSDVGRARCEQCGMQGAQMALKNRESVAYQCHTGLTQFAAPVLADGEIVGCFIGGQVLTQLPDTEKLRHIAEEIGVESEEYIQAVSRVNFIDIESIDRAAKFLYTIADVMSDIAYNKYLVLQSNRKIAANLELVSKAYEELEKSENMKSDFLANMSHEIRTPMNAVIGMAEMALREELPSAAKEYINQIKGAGRSLLTIINDILDFSKIESGKMDITEVDYEPMSMVYDVSNIIMTRLKEKNVELILDVSPNVPNKLWGDNVRIKQVLLNLANNAAKFTSEGKIIIRMECSRTTPDEVSMYICVEDTGIGIKKDDMEKLFHSFQQLDSKRNRNIQGTGLGLAITKNLLELMNGSIWVESEYEKGSKFSCVLPQRIVDDTPSIGVHEPESVVVVGLIFNPYIRESLCDDAARLGVADIRMMAARDLSEFPKDKKIFLFIEHPMFTDVVEGYVRDHPDITAVLLIDFESRAGYDIPNLLVIKKPLFALNLAMILNGDEVRISEQDEGNEFDFIAPEAKVLIVDDNAVNLTVSVGLLEPLKMQIDTAGGGREAIDMISREHYDIVFMDHMMPDFDGVEATHIIRRQYPDYDEVPIIALTANAVEGTKEMFCREGMNDFIAKPIELRMLVAKVRQWLPIEKIRRVYNASTVNKRTGKETDIKVADLDVKFALGFLASEELFWKVLKVFYKNIDKKSKLIKSLEEQESWTNYTVEVHALKNSAKQIGAISLSDKAAALEKAGNERDAWTMHTLTDEMLKQYVDYLPMLEPYCRDDEAESEKKDITADVLYGCFTAMKDAVDNLDMDQMEEVIRQMGQYRYESWQQELFDQLKEASDEMDVDRCEAILRSWEERMASKTV